MTPHFSSAGDWPALTAGQVAQLAALGLDEGDFEFFRDAFAGHRFEFLVEFPGGRRAMLKDRPISNSELIRHLEGHCVYFTGCGRDPRTSRYRTHSFVIDLDAASDIWNRHDRVVSILGCSSLLGMSSASGGLHLWYFLEEAVELHTLRTPSGSGGLIIDLLESGGLPETPGLVEIYPRGKYRSWGTKNRLRLPFGKGSRLLDPLDPSVPLTESRIADLRSVRRLFGEGKIDAVTLPGLQKRLSTRASSPKAVPRTRGKRDKTRATLRGLERRAVVQRLDEIGLERAGQFNDAVFTKALDYRARGVSEEAASPMLRQWLNARHNNMSSTYNRDPEAAHAEAQDVLHRVYLNTEPPARVWVRKPGLSPFEVERIIIATWPDAALADPESGVVYPRLKVQQFLFDTTNAAKQWVLTEFGRAVERVAAAHPSLEAHSARFDELLVAEAQPFWLFPAHPVFAVQMPRTFRVGLAGLSEESAGALWRIAKALGFFVRVRSANAWANRAETFATWLDFGGIEPPGPIHSLALALVTLLPAALLRTKYTAHYLRRIRKEAGVEVQRLFPDAPPSAIDDYLRVWMSGGCPECAADRAEAAPPSAA